MGKKQFRPSRASVLADAIVYAGFNVCTCNSKKCVALRVARAEDVMKHMARNGVVVQRRKR